MSFPKAPPRSLFSVKSVKTLSLTSLSDFPCSQPGYALANSPVNAEPTQRLTPAPEKTPNPWCGTQQQFMIQSQITIGYSSFTTLPMCEVPMMPGTGSKDDDDDFESENSENSYESESERIVSTVEDSLVREPFEVSEEKIMQEFKDINTYEKNVISPHKSFFIGRSNSFKNRYSDIVPYDDTLVQIIPYGKESCFDCFEYSYINASYVPDKASAKWIATQGPLYKTFNEFWRMVYENNISHIVMLANLVERGIPKVDQYWPQPNIGLMKLKCLTVETIHEFYVPDTNDSIIYRQFKIKPIAGDGIPKFVHHFQYCRWPDHGVPGDYDTIINLINIVNNDRKARNLEAAPIVVHCSAGVGRTGTYCAIDMTLREIQEQIALFGPVRGKITFNLYKNALVLRNSRTRMIEQYEQYRFCYGALKHAISKMNLT